MKKDRDLFVISIILLQTLVIVGINHIIRASTDLHIIQRWMPACQLIVLILAILSIVLIGRIGGYQEERIKSSLMKSNLQQVESLLQTMKTEKHEFNHHIQTLQALIYLNRNDEAIRYIEGISGIAWIPEKIEIAGQPVITGLMNSKYNLARSQGIDFAVSVTCNLDNLDMEPWDLSSILSNLIDNAIEAAIKDKCPQVGVEFKHQAGHYLIYIHNNGSKISTNNVEKVFEAGFTTKNSYGRGYGLFIARNLTNRYGGEIKCLAGKNTTFLVNVPEKEAI